MLISIDIGKSFIGIEISITDFVCDTKTTGRENPPELTMTDAPWSAMKTVQAH